MTKHTKLTPFAARALAAKPGGKRQRQQVTTSIKPYGRLHKLTKTEYLAVSTFQLEQAWRNQQVYTMARNGMAPKDIAAEVHLTPTRVRRILREPMAGVDRRRLVVRV